MSRLTLWFSNPNDLAALLVLLAILPFLLAAIPARSGWIAACVLSAIPTFTLGWTASRGGLIALAVGFLVLGLGALRVGLITPARGAAFAVLLLAFGATAFLTPVGSRLRSLAPEEEGTQTRWEVYHRFPAMLSASPWGWGSGNAGESYRQWFEPGTARSSIAYRDLLSSHATWMAEGGWLFSWVYLFGWATAIILPARNFVHASSHRSAAWVSCVSVAATLAAVLAASLSHVADRWEFWLAWAACALPGIATSLAARPRPRGVATSLAASALLALLILGATLLLGAAAEGGISRASDGTVRLGSGKKHLQLAPPDPLVAGPAWGHEIRQRVADAPISISVVQKWRDRGTDAILILTGRIPHDFFDESRPPRHLRWINPPPFRALDPATLALLEQCDSVEFIWGARRRTASIHEWRQFLAETGIPLTLLPRAADYLPDWPEHAVRLPDSED